VKEAFTAWSSCMRRGGFFYPDPLSVGNDAAFGDRKAMALEIRTATADVACKRETKVAGVWLAVETAYQRRLLPEHSTEFAAVQQLIQTRAINATAALRTTK
jgi:hypothetical protein